MAGDRPTFDDLRAVFLNCSLKHEPRSSHTMRLVQRSVGIMEALGVEVDVIHMLEHQVAFGMQKDMTEHGAQRDDWPELHERIMAADVLVFATPIWLGEPASVAALAMERLYAYSSDTNDRGQYAYYGKAGGCIVTGNEDGVKACAKQLLYGMQHIGYSIPPQADTGWIGEIGPGPSYGDVIEGQDRPVGFDSEFTNKNTTFMTWNVLHMARLLRDAGGFPVPGNQGDGWQDVENATQHEPSPLE
ncbi:MAG: flavodoxin family protein [Ilumatobacteraceae bacterium]